jgi:hypothetical protein
MQIGMIVKGYKLSSMLLMCCIGSSVGSVSPKTDEVKVETQSSVFNVEGQSWKLCITDSEVLLKNEAAEEKGALLIQGKLISSCISDIDGDGTDEFLSIERKNEVQYGQDLVIYSYNNGLKELFRQSFEDMKPWKVQTCDVDGDGQKEISVGVFKKTQFHPVMAKRPFIYNYHNNSISPKWRGSRLSRPFEDYIFVDVDGDKKDELVSIELLQDGQNLVNTYKWKGFGFEGCAESATYEKVEELQKGNKKEGKDVWARVKTASGDVWKTLRYENGRLVE